jgi:hypothetical protein
MNTQTIVINKKNVVLGSNNTKYLYKFPKPVPMKHNEIALCSLNMYYSWRNIEVLYNNNQFTYVWWNYQGVLNSVQTITIPNGYYSISTLSAYIQSQMYLRGHYVKDSKTLNKIYFLSMLENPTYYACQITFTSMYAKNSPDAGTNYINENPPTQVYDANNNLVWKGWDWPTTKQFPQVIFSVNAMKDFLGFPVGTFPVSGTPVTTTTDVLSTVTPVTYPVSAINIQCNMCNSEIAIPDNVLYSFSQGTVDYGDLILKEPQNLIWLRVPDGTYSQLEMSFVDQDFQPLKILDDQVNFIILIRDN